MLLKEFMIFSIIYFYIFCYYYFMYWNIYIFKFYFYIELLLVGLEILIDKVKFYEMCWILFDEFVDDSY